MNSRLAIRKALPLDQYPPLLLVPERSLRAVERVEPCVCGNRINQLVGDDVMRTVQAHNMTAAHVAWRMDRESSDGPTALTVASVDVSGHPRVRPAVRRLAATS